MSRGSLGRKSVGSGTSRTTTTPVPFLPSRHAKLCHATLPFPLLQAPYPSQAPTSTAPPWHLKVKETLPSSQHPHMSSGSQNFISGPQLCTTTPSPLGTSLTNTVVVCDIIPTLYCPLHALEELSQCHTSPYMYTPHHLNFLTCTYPMHLLTSNPTVFHHTSSSLKSFCHLKPLYRTHQCL